MKVIALASITTNFKIEVAWESCEDGENNIWGEFSKYKALVIDCI